MNDHLRCVESSRALTFDWSKPSFLSITQIVGLTQAMCIAKERWGKLDMIEPSMYARGYVSRMNVFRMIGKRHLESFHRHDPGNRFIPIERIDDMYKPGTVANKIADMLDAHIGSFEKSPTGAINLSFSEVMDNILTHSASPTFGLAAAQYYPYYGIVELCVADGGEGIVSTMGSNPNYAFYSPDELMRCALEEGYGQYVGHEIYKDERMSGGMGLTYAKRLTQALGGRMWIVSRENALEVSDLGVTSMQGMFYPGTLISIRLPVSSATIVKESQLFPGTSDRPVSWNDQDGWITIDDDGDAGGLLW